MLSDHNKNGDWLIEINFVGLDLWQEKEILIFNHLQIIQTGSGVHHTFYSVATSGSSTGGIVDWA
jgi:hypothetical protein